MAKNKRTSRESGYLKLIDALAVCVPSWTERLGDLYDAAIESLTEKVPNRFKVSKDQWRKWTPDAQRVFNEVYYVMRENPRLFAHPSMELVYTNMSKRDWSTTCWNAAWTAADAATIKA
jgi:hypothetical protein